jgi:Na+/melibiose symporter-like transporter
VRRRGVLIAADIARAALLVSVPVAWWLGALGIGQLYAVVLLCGVGTVFFDVASQSYLPQVVGRPALLAANTRLVGMDAVNDIAGRGAAGYLVALVAAPAAVLVNALGYLVSAWFVTRVRHREPVPARQDRTLWRDMVEGVRFVAGHPLLRPIVLAGAVSNVAVTGVLTMLPVVMVDELGLGAAVLGLFLAAGAAGALVGAVSARRLAARFGSARMFLLGSVLAAPCGFGMPFIAPGPALWVAGAGWFVVSAQIGVNNVLNVSFRQSATPDHLLGRMNATVRFLLTGALAVGAALAAALGQYVSPRAALLAGAIGIAVVFVPIVASPLRRLRELATT